MQLFLKNNNIEKIGIFAIYLLALSMFISRAGISVGFATASFISLIMIFGYKSKVDFKHPIVLAVLTLYIGAAITNIFSPGGIKSSIEALKEWYHSLLIIPLIVLIKNKKQIYITSILLLLSVLVSGVYGLFSWEWSLQVRLGSFLGCMSLAHPLAMILAFMLSFLLYSKDISIGIKLSVGAIYILSVLTLILTQTRGAWLGWIAVAFFLLFTYNKKICAIILALVLVAFLFVPKDLQDRTASITDTGKNSERIALWGAAVDTYLKFPIWGAGTKNGDTYFKKYLSKIDENYLSHGGTAHNTYLSYLYQNGIISVLLFVLLFYIIPYRIIKLWRRMQEHEEKWIFFGVVGAIISFYISGVTQNVHSNQVTGFFFGMCLWGIYYLENEIRCSVE